MSKNNDNNGNNKGKNNVTPIFKGIHINTDKPEVVPQVVETLEWLLSLAREGDLTFIGYVGFGEDTYYQEIIGKFDIAYTHTLGSAFRAMDTEFFDNAVYPSVLGIDGEIID